MSGESGAPQGCERRGCGRPARAWVAYEGGPDAERHGYCTRCLRELAQAHLDEEFARENPVRRDPKTAKFHVRRGDAA